MPASRRMITPATSLKSFAAATCLSMLITAYAARPLVSDDAGVLDARECEIETYAERSRVSGEPANWGASVQPGCGIGWRTQLSLIAARSDGMPATTRLGVAGKTAIIPLAESSAGLTIGYSFEWSRPSGQSFRSDTGLLIAIATFPFQQGWFAHVNAGWQRTQQLRENTPFWGVAIERESVGHTLLDLMAEAYRDSEASPWFALGARYRVIDQWLSINGSIAIKSGSEREKLATLGARLAF